jgi:SNF2 family DNA or RNA helicase
MRHRLCLSGTPVGNNTSEIGSQFGFLMPGLLDDGVLGCDSVIVVGTTTSGCVRATVFDAFSLNYRVILAEEGCFDRSEASHAVSLCDMHAKYADVVSAAEILSYFENLPAALFDLPTGNSRPPTPVREAAE